MDLWWDSRLCGVIQSSVVGLKVLCWDSSLYHGSLVGFKFVWWNSRFLVGYFGMIHFYYYWEIYDLVII